MLTACWWVPPGEGIPPSSAWSGRPCPPSRPAIQILYLECLQNLNTKSPERTQITDKADLHLRKPVLALSHLATKRALVRLRLLQRLLKSFDLLVLPVDLLVQRVDLLLQSSSDVLRASSIKAEHSLFKMNNITSSFEILLRRSSFAEMRPLSTQNYCEIQKHKCFRSSALVA